MKTLLWVSLLVSLLILAIGASWLSLGNWVTATIAPSLPPPVIPPGRENTVMTFLGPVMKNGFSGLTISNISLSGSEIRLQLAQKKDAPIAETTALCALPEWAHAPGTLVIVPAQAPTPQCTKTEVANCGIAREKELVLAWTACTTDGGQARVHARAASEWITALGNRNHEGIWEMPREARDEPKALQAGLLTPIVLATGLDKVFVARTLLTISMVTCFLVGLMLRWRMGPGPAIPERSATQERRGWKKRGVFLGIFLIIGIFLRIHAATTLPRDTDEGFRGEYVQKILSDDHDSWVHPPLYRAVHKAWFDMTGLSDADPTWKLRVPSLVFSILALCFLTATIGALRLPPHAEIPFALAALSPIAVRDSVLARPYGLAMLGATLCLMAIAWRDHNEDKSDDWFSWFVALVALGMTIWTDLVTALLVGTILLAHWLDPRSFSRQSRVSGRMLTAASIVAWGVPFAFGLPGAAAASKELGWPFRTASSSQSAFDQVSTFAWEVFGGFGMANHPSPVWTFIAVVITLFLVVLAIKWTRTSTAIGLGMLLMTLVLVSHSVGMRARNIVFLPVVFAFVGSLVVARAPVEAMQGAVRRWRNR